MTGRQFIAQRIGIWGIIFFPAMTVMFLGCMVAFHMKNETVALGVIALMFIFGLGGGIALAARIVCPICKKWISPVTGFSFSPMCGGIPRKVKYCPLCGVDFDQELNNEK